MKLAFVSCSSWSFKNKFLKVVVHLSLEIVCSLYMNHDAITSFFSSLKKKSHACLHKSLWKKQNETFICFIVVRKCCLCLAFLSLSILCVCVSLSLCAVTVLDVLWILLLLLLHCSCLMRLNKIPHYHQTKQILLICASSALQQTYKYIDRRVA